MKLQQVKTRLHAQSSTEPTIVEWAAAAGISCRSLKLQIHIGTSSRQKLIYANFRMVVHIAKQYQGRGLNLQDLMQVIAKFFLIQEQNYNRIFCLFCYWK